MGHHGTFRQPANKHVLDICSKEGNLSNMAFANGTVHFVQSTLVVNNRTLLLDSSAFMVSFIGSALCVAAKHVNMVSGFTPPLLCRSEWSFGLFEVALEASATGQVQDGKSAKTTVPGEIDAGK